MDIIYWLIPLSIVILFVAILIFFWAVKNDQFSDLDSPAVNILLDDDLSDNLPIDKNTRNLSDNLLSEKQNKG